MQPDRNHVQPAANQYNDPADISPNAFDATHIVFPSDSRTCMPDRPTDAKICAL